MNYGLQGFYSLLLIFSVLPWEYWYASTKAIPYHISGLKFRQNRPTSNDIYIQRAYFLHSPLHSRETKRRQRIASTNTADYWADKTTNTSKPTAVSEDFFTDQHTANDISLIPFKLVLFNRELKAYAKLEEHISSHEATHIYYFLILFYIRIFLYHYFNLYSITVKISSYKRKSVTSS